MADTSIPYKLYKTNANGIPTYQILPGTNTPYGWQEATPQEVQDWYKNPSGFYRAGQLSPLKDPSKGLDTTGWTESDFRNYMARNVW